MLILDIPSPFDGSKIKIPLFHRGHLSLFPDAKVWLCLLPGVQSGQFLPEIVISPIEYESWGDLWRISVTLHERRGLVHDVYKVLADYGLNIIAAESTSMERQRLHSIEILVNANKYTWDGDTLDRSTGRVEELKNLRRIILARVLHDIAFLRSGEPRLRIRRVRHLFEAMRSFDQANKEAPHLNLPFKPLVSHAVVQKTATREVSITLPPELRKSLLAALGSNSKSEKVGQYLLISNTSDRFLRVYFVRDSDAIVAPTLLHDDEVGALAAITGQLRAAEFNILTSLSRLYKWGGQAHTEFVLQPPDDLRSAKPKDIERRLKRVLMTPELDKSFKLSICYPKNYRTPLRPTRLRCSASKAVVVGRGKPGKDAPVEATHAILSRQVRRLLQIANSPSRTEEDVLRNNLARNLLLEEEATAEVSKSSIKNSVFISSSYQDEGRFEQVCRAAKKGFNVITAKDYLPPGLTNRPAIVKLMSNNCTHFLGVWTEAGGTRVGRSYLPSPWLYWELGVANTLGLHWHLLISEKVHEEAWKRLAAETQHTFYSERHFESQLKKALGKLQSMLPNSSP